MYIGMCHGTRHGMPWHDPLLAVAHAMAWHDVCCGMRWHMPWHAMAYTCACNGICHRMPCNRPMASVMVLIAFHHGVQNVGEQFVPISWYPKTRNTQHSSVRGMPRHMPRLTLAWVGACLGKYLSKPGHVPRHMPSHQHMPRHAWACRDICIGIPWHVTRALFCMISEVNVIALPSAPLPHPARRMPRYALAYA